MTTVIEKIKQIYGVNLEYVGSKKMAVFLDVLLDDDLIRIAEPKWVAENIIINPNMIVVTFDYSSKDFYSSIYNPIYHPFSPLEENIMCLMISKMNNNISGMIKCFKDALA